MTMIKPAYTNEGKNTNKDLLKIRLNEEERNMIARAQIILKQPKKSTTMKQLAKIGFANVVSNPETMKIIEIIYNNKRKNYETGVSDPENML